MIGERTHNLDIVATDISEDEYMENYAADFCEYVEGTVLRLPLITLEHDALVAYFRMMLDTYSALRPIGRAINAPFVMKASPEARRREPDVQVILHSNPGQLTDTAMLGAADICLEIVTEGSEELDYGTKFVEYQRAGVREYWILDPLRRDYRFFRLNEAGIYIAQPLDSNGRYTTPLLPGLQIDVERLWQVPLPDPLQTGEAVKLMLKNVS